MENGKVNKTAATSPEPPPPPPPPGLARGYDTGNAKITNQHGELSQSEIAALKCSKCSFLLREPRQVITCGHRYCQQCIEQLINGGDRHCLIDKESFTLSEVKHDKGCLRDILAIEVTCPTAPPCSWKGRLIDMETHVDSCPQAMVVCDLKCGKQVKRENLSKHHSQCPKRPTKCQHCKKDIPYDSLQVHYEVCEEHPVTCKFCQQKLDSRKKLADHLEEDCDEYYMECVHTGCSFKGRKSEMVQHVLSKHLLQSMEKMVSMESKVIQLESENKELRGKLTDCHATVSELEAQTEKLMQENKQKSVDIESLKSIIEQLQKENDECVLDKIENREAMDAIERDGPTKSQVRALVQSKALPKYQLKGLASQSDLCDSTTPFRAKFRVSEDKAIRSLNGEPPLPPQYEPVYSLTGTVPDVTRPDVELNRVKQDVEVMQSKLRHLNEIVQSSQDNQTRYGVAIDEIRLRQDVLDVKTVNGILIWKIPDIRRRYRDAVDRRTISLYSPPFYTSPHGYRMCIRTYLNGDGIGKGTHLSLFFVVMRSEQDNLLAWPFKQSVRFTLINQKNPSASITEAFVPDLNSPSFQKPENDMNIASGFPKFCRQSVLQDEEFTVGNMIYIKCQVDLAGLSIQ